MAPHQTGHIQVMYTARHANSCSRTMNKNLTYILKCTKKKGSNCPPRLTKAMSQALIYPYI